MTIKVLPAPLDGGIEVPTMVEFKALVGRVEAIERALNAPRVQSGRAMMTAVRPNGDLYHGIKLGWRASKVDTNPVVEVEIQDDGFILSSRVHASTNWTAHG